MISNALTIYLPPDLLKMLDDRALMLKQIQTNRDPSGALSQLTPEFNELNDGIVRYLGNLALTKAIESSQN